MWDPQRFTALWAFTAWYRDSFTFLDIKKLKRSTPAPKKAPYHRTYTECLFLNKIYNSYLTVKIYKSPIWVHTGK
jgi:hypothetical protein